MDIARYVCLMVYVCVIHVTAALCGTLIVSCTRPSSILMVMHFLIETNIIETNISA